MTFVLGMGVGLVIAAFIAAIVLVVHGGRGVRDDDRRRAERMNSNSNGGRR